MRSSEPRRLVSSRRFGRPPDRLHVAYARPTRLERMAVMSPTRRDRSWDRHRDVRLSVHLQRVPRTRHRGDDVACEAVTGTPAVVIGPPSLVVPPDAHRWPPERHPRSDARSDLASPTRREHGNGSVVRCSPPPSPRRVRTVPVAAFSAFAVSHRGHAHRLAQGHPRPLPRGCAARPLRASRGVEDWLARRLRDVLRIIHGLPTGCPFGDLAKGAAASSLAPFVADRAASAAPRACPRRTFARASPNPRTVRLSASRLPSLTARRGSNLPSRAVGSS